ncbi:acyltransferase family protein [Nocardia sp. N13]|uniref:acyltransferase family protein n=1 Tax=Nocardioides sp. N13(2025) TaxID=3453405 RepID=UPI003F76CF3C
MLLATGRLLHLDNLKVVLIALIIALHAVLGYVGLFEAWTYAGVRETTLHPVVEMVLLVVLSPFGFFLISLLFLVAGLLTPGSYDRKGGRRFVTDRLLRLGVPFAIYVLLVQPSLVYPLEHRFGDATGTYWQEYLGAERQVDTGPLWFVGVLLVYSLAYAAWRRLAGPDRRAPRPPTMRTLVVSALVVAPTSFVVRLVYPYGGESGFTDLNLWEWPACIAVFVIGLRAARSGWAHAIPADLVRASRWLTAVAVVAMTALLYVVGATDSVEEMFGGWSWYAVAFACIEALLVVFGPVWLLDLSSRRLDRSLPWGEQLGRSAYGAFMLQTPFLLGLAVAMRPVPLPAEAKAVLVAAGAVALSFGASWLLVRRVPGMSRIL